MLACLVTFHDKKLCYIGQKCQKIPELLRKLYGQQAESLDLSYNELISIEGLNGFPHLKELVLDNNHLTDSLNFPYLPNLHTLSLNKNNICDLESVILKISESLPNITYFSMLGNKACPNELSGEENDEEDYKRYRYYVLYHLPKLKFLDSSKVSKAERAEAHRRGKFMNIIRPKESNLNESITITGTSNTDNFTPLPNRVRSPADHRGAYGKCRYRYSGKHSEGNRFIFNTDL